eukprot:TRINITY_DN4525_c0_g1_i1.p1 TRINITY_DN4525_c0_g1~~TRINITY_DN4525_c0_g1_i1.p1  ORF type:complete len:118 (-),score=28.72 TRINITY_DN4525_c0_g1_i1:24-377(-)
MSPEAIFEQKYSAYSDVFSFGVVIWEILTLDEPWAGLSPLDSALKIKEGKRLQIPPRTDPILEKLMKKCWEAIPEDRPTFVEILSLLGQTESETQLSLQDNPDPHPFGAYVSTSHWN